ncbi:hypothetical protein BIW19_16690 [Pseudomonas putida]|nr:hypothetical protein BIW19_16690 [Pseudomonas putida]
MQPGTFIQAHPGRSWKILEAFQVEGGQVESTAHKFHGKCLLRDQAKRHFATLQRPPRRRFMALPDRDQCTAKW